MAGKTVNPTRMELTRLKGRLKTARRGHKLLKDKRDELMKQFMDVVRRNRALRAKVEQGLKEANAAFTVAAALMGTGGAGGGPVLPAAQRVAGGVHPEHHERERAGVHLPDRQRRRRAAALWLRPDQRRVGRGAGEDAGGIRRYAGAGAGGKDHAAAGPGHRKDPPAVNALEYVMIPETEQNIRYITMKLDENERGNTTRLMKVKEMVLQDAHHYQP